MLPKVRPAEKTFCSDSRKLLIIAEGFEKRSLYWINNPENETQFDRIIVITYEPKRNSHKDEMINAVKRHSNNTPHILSYNRFEPTVFEHSFKDCINDASIFDEIVLDISVMSKLLIMIVLTMFKDYCGVIKVLYTEPESWGPSEEKYKTTMDSKTYGTCIGLSSIGVGSIVRTPMLSSIIMQDCPVLLIAFLSFNEQLLNALINDINPTKLRIINHKCSRAEWREHAMLSIHEEIINEYKKKDETKSIESFDLLDYSSVFDYLATIYRDNCYTYRIVLSPTGCKIHTIACSILKMCCPDIHIEYPTPESYLFEEYSSENNIAVHEIVFSNLKKIIEELSVEYSLNG